MAYIEFNNNPVGRRTGDCVVRAISKALNLGLEAAHLTLDINAIAMGDMPSANSVWGSTFAYNCCKYYILWYNTIGYTIYCIKGFYILGVLEWIKNIGMLCS